MPTDMYSKDLLVFGVIVLVVFALVLIADMIIFCYWLSFKYKEYSFQQAYGPVLSFPPREMVSYEGAVTEVTSETPSAIEPDLIAAPQEPIETAIPDAAFPTPPPLGTPVFDFLPLRTTDEVQVASVLHVEPGTVHERDSENAPARQPAYLIDVSQGQSIALENSFNNNTNDNAHDFTDDGTSAAEPVQIAEPVEPLEDTRHIDPLVLGASGGIRSPFAPTWSLVHPFLGLQAVLAAVTIISTVAILPKMFAGGQNVMTSSYGMIVVIASLFIQNAGFVGVTAFLVKGYGTSLSRIGLRAPTRREVGLGLLYGAGICLAATLLEKGLDIGAAHLVPKAFMGRMTKLTDGLSAGGQFEQIHSIPFQIWFIIAGAIAAPIGEEVFFRGLLYNSLKKRWGIPAGVVLSGICFGLIHFAPLAIIVIIPMGFLLAIVYERTKSLWVTILMHSVNNGAQLLFAMYTMNHPAGH